MQKHLEHLEIPAEYSAAIEATVVRWNHLEQIMNLFLIYLLGKSVYEDRSHIVLAHMAFPQKFDVLSALAKEAEKIPEYFAVGKHIETILPLL